MHRSVSEHSIGAITVNSAAPTLMSQHEAQHKRKTSNRSPRGQFLFQETFQKYTLAVLTTPFNMWFQGFVIATVVYKYIIHFLRAYYYKEPIFILDMSSYLCEAVFVCDLYVHLVHAYWPLVRVYTRVYRRNIVCLTYDLISLLAIPLMITAQKDKRFIILATIARWLAIGRIYRVFVLINGINQNMRASRKLLYTIEHLMLSNLILHAATCLWYDMRQSPKAAHDWYNLGFPKYVDTKKIEFDGYMTCWYYCACRFYNTIFGDTFPTRYTEKWLTSILMLVGYVFFRYNFIGKMAWELVLQNSRRSGFVDRYHHMIEYLKIRGAPPNLIEQAKRYKKHVWEMKDGVLRAKQLKKLPVPLQMELIFDINVGHLQNTLLFRDTEEAFMRQISLTMRHELYLAGQHIWSQGVVKNGMICVKQGVLEMLSDEDDESPIIAFSEGTVLGELSLFYSIPSKVTVKAATYVELQVLRRTDFMRVMSEHPFVLEQIRRKIGRRLKMSRDRQEAIMKYDKDDSRLIRTQYRPMKVLKDNLAGVEEEDPTFVDDSHMYYRDENNVRQPKFTPEFLELYQMTDKVTTIETPHICLRSNFPWILEPNTGFTNMFDVAHFVIVLYLCIMSPQFALNDSLSDTEKVLATVVLTGLLINIYIQLTTAIVFKNVKKVTVKEIAEVKMATFGFYLDILSVFPVHIFIDTLDPHGESAAGQVVKLFPVLQVWHIWDYIGKWEKNFDANLRFLNVLKYSLITLIFSYWSGCILYLYACPRKLCRKNSWMSHLMYWETKVFTPTAAKHEKPMLTSFSFGTSVFTGSGASEISPSSSDCILVVFLFIIGGYVSSIYIAKITSIYLLSTWRKLRFKESMRELFYFLSVNHVSNKIKTRVKKFFCVQWYYNKAVSTQSLFKDVSSNIQQEVLSIEMVETLLYCPLFQECNRDFLQTVAANVRTIVLPDNEIVQHAADIGRDIYILQKGHCNLLNHNGKILRSLAPGSHFGVFEMLFGLPKVYTVLTSTNCILLHVEYTALVQCWSTFPDISHPIITVLHDPELIEKTAHYEEARPLTGHLNVKTNRIAQEIRESFVVLSGREEKAHYVKTFERLGVMRHLQYIFAPGVITPHGIFLKVWCAMRFLSAIEYVLTIPYAIAIKQHKYQDTYYWADIFLYVDIIVMSYVAYYNDKNLLVTHPLLTVTRYLKGAFLFDLISVFPFDQLVKIVNDNANLDLYRVNKILTVYTVLTSTNCILLHVEYTALVQCWSTFPDISHPIITVLHDPELIEKTAHYEEARPLTGHLNVKTNRIAQEIRESFVVLSGREEKAHYVKTFERLGVMRHLQYIFAPGVITPHGIFLKVWCAMRFLSAIEYVLTIPYAIAIKQHKYQDTYYWADIFLYVDIIVMSYVAYYNDKNLLVTHPLLTVTRYLKGAFLFDLISVFPFDQLVKIVNDNANLDLYRVNKILTVTRITGAFSFWESDIMRVNPAVVLMKFLPIALTFVNVATAFVFHNTCSPYWSDELNQVMVNCTRTHTSPIKYDSKNAVAEYINTLYWVFEIFVGVGCTPVIVVNQVNVVLIMALQIVGLMYFAFMFGYVASTRSAAAQALLEHTEKTKDLSNFLYQENVDLILTNKTLKYFEYVWKRTNGSNPQQICRRLNSALMEDTLVFMYERALREVPLFGKVERSFIRVITQHLKEMYFLKGDTVIQCKDIHSSIYIIYRGKVDVLSSYNEMITCMGPGGMFGNFTGQSTSCSEVTVYASRSLDLLMISSQTFFNLVKYYPRIQEPLNKAFEISTNYILPITMDMSDDSSSEGSEADLQSLDSMVDSKSSSSRFESPGQMSIRSSHSNVSQAKSTTSTSTVASYLHISNLLRPGTFMYQGFGYVTCFMAVANYALVLYEITTLNDCVVLFWLQAILDIFFYVRVYLTMHQGYVTRHGDFITEPSKCRKRYYRHKLWVWTDFLVNVPLCMLAFCFRDPVTIMHYFRLNKLFRVKYLCEFYHRTAAELTNNLTLLQIVMTMAVVVICIHTFSCVWLLGLMAISPISVIRTVKMHLIDEETPLRNWDYTTSVYIIVSELTTTGGDEFFLSGIPPMVVLTVILICSKTLAALVVATSIQVAYSTKYALNSYEKQTGKLIDFLMNQGLSGYQLKKFWTYVQQLWITERGRQLPALIEQTPYVRRCDVMSAMFGHHLSNCYLFAATGEAFLRQLSVLLDYTVFFPGNYIVVAGDSEARMYWIASGVVSVVSVRSDLTETTHELLEQGDVFGIMQGLNRGVPHSFSYRAETKVSILTLSLDSWIDMLPFFPEVKKIIEDRAEVLFTKI